MLQTIELFVNVHETEFYGENDPSYMYTEISYDMYAKILKLQQIVKDDEIYCAALWDDTPVLLSRPINPSDEVLCYVSYDGDGTSWDSVRKEDMLQKVYNVEDVRVGIDRIGNDVDWRMGACQLFVMKNTIEWRIYLKHGPTEFRTCEVPIKSLTEFLKKTK